MKIAMIGQKGFPSCSGGIEKHVEELSKGLVKQGHEVLVFCRAWYSTKEKDKSDVEKVFAPCVKSKHFDAISHTFFSILKAVRLDVDVIHIHGVGPSLLAWLPRLLKPSVKVVVTFHCIDRNHAKWGWAARTMLHLGEMTACRLPHKTITVSEALTEYTYFSYGAETAYIPNGVTMPEASRKPELTEQFGLEPDKYFLMVSRLVRHKSAHTLIAAWKKALEARPELFAGKKLAIVGGSSFTDDYVRELEELTASEDSVVMTGSQTGDVLHELFANAFAAVHPSTSEGLPIAILEEMSYGKCVLSSDIPENIELTGRHGLTFETGNIEELAQNLIMMAESPKLVRHVGREAAEHVNRNYNWDEIVLTTERLYENLLDKTMVAVATNR